MLPQILISLIPLFVSQAETQLSGQAGSNKRDWVLGAVKELEPLLKRIEPAWLQNSLDIQEKILNDAIDIALNAMKAA